MVKTRRHFLQTTALTAAQLAWATPAVFASDSPEEKPNILWITCEDMSPNLGCYGDPFAISPTLDQLASEGVRYTEAYAICGVCAPNRSCLITGVYPSTLGSHNMRCTTCLPDFVKCFPEYLRTAGYYCTNNSKTDYNFPPPKTAWDESSKKAHWRKRKPGQPFFSVFNFTITHESQYRLPDDQFFKKTSRLTPSQRHDPKNVPLPPFHPDTPEVRQDWSRYYDEITAMDYQVADILKQLEEDGLTDNTLVFFFSDHGVGMPGCKKWVWESGLHVPFIIRFPQKYHHWLPSQPGTASDRLVSFVDFAPTVLSLAGIKIPSHMQGKPFLGSQAVSPRNYIYAIRDRMAERYDIVRVVRNKSFQYMRNYFPHVSWSQFTSYTSQMPTMQVWQRMHEEGKLNQVQDRYFAPTKPLEELYDVKNDPHQIHNLAGDPAHRSTLEKMRALSIQWMIDTHDLGLLPEYEIEKRAKDKTPYDVGHDNQLNPLPRLIHVAHLANQMNEKNMERLVELLRDKDSAIRYWAAIGLVALNEKAHPAANALRKAIHDPAWNVRIAAAEALIHVGYSKDAIPVLLTGLQHETAFIRLRAMNVLDRMGSSAKPYIAAMRQAKMKQKSHVGDYLARMADYVPQKLEKE